MTTASERIMGGANDPTRPSVETSHSMLISLGFGIGFVMLAVILSGVNDQLASAMVALMLLLIAIQMITNVDVFLRFLQTVDVLPPE